MRKMITLIALMNIASLMFAQTSKFPEVDKSPLDVMYYPVNYTILKIQNKVTEGPIARVIYSRPQKQGRKIFGELVEYGKVWRLGANEATEIEFFKDVKIGSKKVPKGRYTLYALVNEDTWTFIVNKDTDTWGAFKYDSKKDVCRLTVPVEKTDDVVENMSMMFEKSATGASLIIAWEQVRVVLPITL